MPRYGAFLAIIMLLLVSGCASMKRAQVRTALQDVGMAETDARCLARPLVRDLSTSQLKTLKKLKDLFTSESNDMSEADIMQALNENLDPETVGAVLVAVSECAMGGGI